MRRCEKVRRLPEMPRRRRKRPTPIWATDRSRRCRAPRARQQPRAWRLCPSNTPTRMREARPRRSPSATGTSRHRSLFQSTSAQTSPPPAPSGNSPPPQPSRHRLDRNRSFEFYRSSTSSSSTIVFNQRHRWVAHRTPTPCEKNYPIFHSLISPAAIPPRTIQAQAFRFNSSLRIPVLRFPDIIPHPTSPANSL